MTSTYSPIIQIEEPATNDQNGSWGTTANTNYNIIEQAIAGVASVSVTSANVTLSYSSPPTQTNTGRNMVLRLTGTSTGSQTIFVNAASKVYIVDNQTSGGYAHSIQVVGGGGTAVSVPNGTAMLVYTDGTNFYVGQTYMSGFVLTSGATMTGTLNCASNGLNVGSGQLQVTGGNVSISGTVSAAASTPGSLTVSGASALNGNTTLGATSSQTLTTNAVSTFAASVTFSSTATFSGAMTVNANATIGASGANTVSVLGTATFTPLATFASGLQVVAGGATTPTVRCQTNTNTGLYVTGSNGVGLTASGVTHVHADGSGHVGIGTQVPAYNLQVIGTLAQRPGASVNPLTIGDLVMEATSDTSVTVKLKGSDGTVRTAVLTLS